MPQKYMNFPCEDLELHDGDIIHLIIIPAGNEWGKLMGITDETIWLCVGKPIYDEHPPNTAFFRQEMLSKEDALLRMGNLVFSYKILAGRYEYITMLLGPDILCPEILGLTEAAEVAKKLIEQALSKHCAASQ